jgi:hypothetical protein
MNFKGDEVSEFKGFPKIARFSREIIITEKIDGTNAQIVIGEDGSFRTGSRNRWVTPEDDNYGFAAWAMTNKEELMKLGPGQHFGEWFGYKIQRGYGRTEKAFALFNTNRWRTDRPSCCEVVPVLYQGPFSDKAIDDCIELLRTDGSRVTNGFMRPEGIVIYHTAANILLKKTLEKDEMPKTLAEVAS